MPSRSTLVLERRRHPPRLFQDALLATSGLDGFLQQLVAITSRVIGHDAASAVTVIREGHHALVVRSGEFADPFDGVGDGSGDGPALTALATGRIVVIEDVVTEDRFARRDSGSSANGNLAPEWRSALFLPLDAGTDTVGVLSLFGHDAHVFGSAQQAEATRFSREASGALNLAVRREHDLEITGQLREALVSRTVIDQGIGIIMGQNRCDAAAAFGILRAASQNRNVKLRVVSAEIVTAVSHKPPAPGNAFVG